MITRKTLRQSRQKRIRAVVTGTAGRPRLAVFKSNTALKVQIVNDENGTTVLSAECKGKNISAGQKLGMEIAQKAKSKKIETVVFDRGGYKYHGVVKALAVALREGGLQF